MKNHNALLGDILKARRLDARLAISTVATAAEISSSYYFSIENSKRVPPSSTLARILGVLSFGETEARKLKQLAAVERGLAPDDAELPDDVQALISDIRRAAACMPPGFTKALRTQIREISS